MKKDTAKNSEKNTKPISGKIIAPIPNPNKKGGKTPHHLSQIMRKGGEVAGGMRAPKKLTTEAYIRIHEEFNYDPLREAINIASGVGSGAEHPFLGTFLRTLAVWNHNIENGTPITQEDIAEFAELGGAILADSYVPLELRAKFVALLLEYVYPKRKSTEYGSANVERDLGTKPLSADEIKLFRSVFDGQY